MGGWLEVCVDVWVCVWGVCVCVSVCVVCVGVWGVYVNLIMSQTLLLL